MFIQIFLYYSSPQNIPRKFNQKENWNTLYLCIVKHNFRLFYRNIMHINILFKDANRNMGEFDVT